MFRGSGREGSYAVLDVYCGARRASWSNGTQPKHQTPRRTMRTPIGFALVAASATTAPTVCLAFHHSSIAATRTSSSPPGIVVASAGTQEEASSTTVPKRNKCGYLFEGRWEQRKDLAQLKVGDALLGRKLDGCDLLSGATGPKIFFECGVGRIDNKGKWHMVNGMLRLGRRGAKKSVTAKRVARLTDKVVELYVSRIDISGGMLEVTTSQEQAEGMTSAEKKIPASSLKAGDELVGTVVKVQDFGVFVDVGANRLGLLHIQRVADLMDTYIKKAEGLASSGLERGAKIKVAVMSNNKKRLFLDFTSDVKEEAEAERRKKQGKELEKEKEAAKKKEEEAAAAAVMEKDEAAAWAAYGAGADDYDDASDWAAFAAGDDDTYDEDDDIEDALGIGSYR